MPSSGDDAAPAAAAAGTGRRRRRRKKKSKKGTGKPKHPPRRPQLAVYTPQDISSPTRVARGDLDMEKLLAELRGNLELLEGALERGLADGSMRPQREAMIRKKVARTKFRIWVESLDNTLLPDVQEAYGKALAFPSNEGQALLWWELARVYVMYGAYDGGTKVFDRLLLDFATFERMPAVLMSRAALYRRQGYFLEASKTFLSVLQKGVPAPYTFTDVMLHIAWCYELHAEKANDDFYRKEAREGFAAAYLSTDHNVNDAVRLFGSGASLEKTWQQWRQSTVTWLRLGRRHSEQHHVILAADVFNEATRLRLLREAAEPEPEVDPVLAAQPTGDTAGERRSRLRRERLEQERRDAESGDSGGDSEFGTEEEEESEEEREEDDGDTAAPRGVEERKDERPVAPVTGLGTDGKVLSPARAKLLARAGSGAGAGAGAGGPPPKLGMVRGAKPGSGPVYISSDSGTDLDSGDEAESSLDSEARAERDAEREAVELRRMVWEDVNVQLERPISPTEVPPTMRMKPPSLPQPASKWDRQVTWDDEVRQQLPKRVARKSAVEEATLWMFATDTFLRSDQNEAAHQAAQSAIRGAQIGDVTASAALSVLSKSNTDLGKLMHSRAASHLMFLSMRWITRVRLRMRRRRASSLIGRSWRQYRYRKRYYARLMLQSRCKGWLYWLKYTRTRNACFPVQCWWRMLRCMWTKRELMRTRVRWALLITQRNIRMWINREQFVRWVTASIIIQRYFRSFMARVRAFMWERYHFYAAQELEHWKGTNIGCTVIPKKFVRQYDASHRVPVQRDVLGSTDFLPALSTLALDGSLAATPSKGPLSVSVGGDFSELEPPRGGTAAGASTALVSAGAGTGRSSTTGGKPSTVMLHPHDRIVQSKVIPTRIEMLAEELIWGRADDMAENLAFADVNAQQGAIWGYNDGEQEIADWGGFYTLFTQIHGIKRGKGRKGTRHVFSPTLGKAGPVGHPSRRHALLTDGHHSDDAADDDYDWEDVPLEFPGVSTVRSWMKALPPGALPSWNRGVAAMWEVYVSGWGTKFYGPNRHLYTYRSPHTCAEPMHTCAVPDAVLQEAAAVGVTTATPVHRHRQHGMAAGAKFFTRDIDRNAETAELALTGLQAARPWSRGGDASEAAIAQAFPGHDQPFSPSGRKFVGVLTPTKPVRVGWCSQFEFEWAGRWGCDLINWTHGLERNLWDLNLWLSSDAWGFPYGSYDFFLVFQRWLASIPSEVRLWAKKRLDWRSMLDEQLQTTFRFSKRAFLDALRACGCRKTYLTDTCGWYAGWVPRYRHGRVAGAVPPAATAGVWPGGMPHADDDDDDGDSGGDDAGVAGWARTAASTLPLIVTHKSAVSLTALHGAGGGRSSRVGASAGAGVGAGAGAGAGALASSASATTLQRPRRKPSRGSSTRPPSAGLSPSASGRAASRRLRPLSPATGPESSAQLAWDDTMSPSAPPSALVRFQHPVTVRHEAANALVVRFVMQAFEDVPVNRGTLVGDWVSDGIAELIVAVEAAKGMLAPTLAALKRRAVRWYTMQQTCEDNDALRLRGHEANLRAAKQERQRRTAAVKEERNRTMQEPAVRMLAYRKTKDGTQMFKLYKELILKEVKRRRWKDVVELLQACAEEPLIQQTPVYLKSAVSYALKHTANVVQNRGLDSDASKFAEAKPRSFWDGGRGNPDEVAAIVKVETGGGDFPPSAMAVTAIGWAAQHGIKLDRDTLCDALRTTTVPGGWQDAMYVYKLMKKSNFSMAAPVFDIMSLVCQNTYGDERPKLYEALKAAGASYALCFAAATMKGV